MPSWKRSLEKACSRYLSIINMISTSQPTEHSAYIFQPACMCILSLHLRKDQYYNIQKTQHPSNGNHAVFFTQSGASLTILLLTTS